MPAAQHVTHTAHALAKLPQAFAAVRLQSHRLVDFVRERRQVLRSLTLTNSEGYWVRRSCCCCCCRK